MAAFFLPSWSKFLKCLAVEFVWSGFVGAKPQVTLLVYVDGEQGDIFVAIFDRIMGHAFPVVAPDSCAPRGHP